MRINFRNISINSLLVTYLHYSNLYNRIEQFVKNLRKNNAITRIFLLRNCVIQ